MIPARIPNGERGVAVRLVNHDFLFTATHNAHPLQSLREAVQNAIEAGATQVDIFAGPRGSTVILDNGSGMTKEEIERFFGGLGESSKQLGREGNMGFGLTFIGPRQNPKGVQITSWKNRARAFRVTIGVYEGEGKRQMVGFLRNSTSGDEVVSPVEIPTWKGIEQKVSGTQVVLTGLEFQPYVFNKYLNSRYLVLPKNVRINIWRSEGERGEQPRPVWGALSCIERLCSQHGTVELPHGVLYWGVKKHGEMSEEEQTYLSNFASDVWDPPTLAFAWKGEIHESWSFGRGGRQKVNSWGIRSGASQVIMIIDAKGRSIAPALDRSSFTGWEEDEAQSEVIDNLPRELVHFMRQWEDREFDSAAEVAMVQTLLALGDSPTPPMPNKCPDGMMPPAKLDEDEEDDRESRSPSRGRKLKKPRKSARALGRPSVVFVPATELGSDSCGYDGIGHRILVNADHSMLAFLTSAEGAVLRQARALIAYSIIDGFVTHVDQYGDVPEQPQLESFLTAGRSVAKLKVNQPEMVRIPRSKTKVRG